MGIFAPAIVVQQTSKHQHRYAAYLAHVPHITLSIDVALNKLHSFLLGIGHYDHHAAVDLRSFALFDRLVQRATTEHYCSIGDLWLEVLEMFSMSRNMLTLLATACDLHSLDIRPDFHPLVQGASVIWDDDHPLLLGRHRYCCGG